MPYYKRYHKSSKFRRYRKNRFSKYNTYKNRSSKAQAGQIYALNKKVNNIERKTRPELIQHLNPAYQATINFTTLSNNWYTTAGQAHFTPQTWETNIKDKMCRINKLILYGVLEREAGTDGTIDTKGSCLVRMAILQTKQEKTSLLTPSYLFSGNEGTLDYKAPLLAGASSEDRILGVFNIDLVREYQNMKNFKITIPLKYKQYVKPAASSSYGKGYLYAVCQFFSDQVGAKVRYVFTLRSKLLYTDA